MNAPDYYLDGRTHRIECDCHDDVTKARQRLYHAARKRGVKIWTRVTMEGDLSVRVKQASSRRAS